MALDLVTIYRVNDQILTIEGLQNNKTNAFCNAATVKATLYDRSTTDAVLGNNKGTVVASFQDVPFDYVAGTDGNYETYIDSSFDAPAKTGYVLVVDAQDGVKGHWEIPVEIVER